MTLRWWSQPFAPEGSAAAEGIVKQLGQPALDPLTVLVREAAQNSWDARRPGARVEFSIDIRVLGPEISSWREWMLPGPIGESHVDLDRFLRSGTVMLVVSDRNTVGLGGPLRAGERASSADPADFVQFLRNVGEPSDHRYGGGTYGFGKGIFYRISNAGAILVDTNTVSGGPFGRRLMGAALGGSYFEGNRRFTGRHWWGFVGADNVPDPILSERAARMSAALSLPGFDDGRTGTDIVILAANLGSSDESGSSERSAYEAANFIMSSVLWHLWPKMIPDDEGNQMDFFVGVNGSRKQIASPGRFSELAPFVESLRVVRKGSAARQTRTTPPKEAGFFALSLGAASSGKTNIAVAAAKPFDGPAHHVARMRVAELVVDYLPGPLHPDPLLAYGAVFKSSEQADSLFAAAEPPTHDDWISKGLTGTAKGVVDGARRFIRTQLDETLRIGLQATGDGGGGLGALSVLLASVVPAPLGESDIETQESRGSSRSRGNSRVGSGASGGSSARRGDRVRLVGVPVLEIIEAQPFLVARVNVPAASVHRIVSAQVEVVVEGGGRESEPPLGAVLPKVIEWRSGSGERVQGRSLRLALNAESDWYVYATYVPDAVVRFQVTEELADAE